MMETSKERVELLRAGFTQSQIEELYIKKNNIKIVKDALLIELVEIDEIKNKKNCVNCLDVVESAHSFGGEMKSIYSISQLFGFLSKNPFQNTEI